MKYLICHFTSVHPRHDSRLYIKECSSLVNSNYRVKIILADGKPDEIKNNIEIENVVVNKTGRFQRMTVGSYKVYKAAIKTEADLYHFHDPELLPFAYLMKLKGKKVIYDVHEDVPRDILSKYWIPKFQRYIIAKFIEVVENFVSKRLTYIIAATPYIGKRFKKLNKNTTVINNYPLSQELYSANSIHEKKDYVCYIGGINRERGIYEIIDALSFSEASLYLAGEFESDKIEIKARSRGGWQKVLYLGFINRITVKKILAESIAGIVTFHPSPNHINAQPNKIFEYMSAGLPVIASNFPLWKEIIEGNNCGICVDPNEPVEIARAINYLMENKDIARKMGENGKKAVDAKYNWKNEEEKLLKIYQQIIKK